MRPDDEDEELNNHDYRHKIEIGARIFNVIGKIVLYAALVFCILYLIAHYNDVAFQSMN